MTDILIIGGGIIGMLTAHQLRLAGASVRILERNQMAQESTWAGGGILSPLYPWRYPNAVTALARWGQERYPDYCATLLASSGKDAEYEHSGLLIQAEAEQDQALAWAAQHGSSIELIDQNQIAELEPNLVLRPNQALWMPDVGQVRNPRFAAALLAEIKRIGVQISEHTEVTDIPVEKGIARVSTAQGNLSAGKVIVCAGAWSRTLLLTLGYAPKIEPVKGQMLVFQAQPGVIRHMCLMADRYVIPRRDGHILFGSTIEHTGFDKSTNIEARVALEQIAKQRYPVLGQFPIEKHWAGLRPGTPDGIPYIGQHPAADNLYLNAGHFRNGVVLGLASARLAADLVLGRETIVNPADYSPINLLG